jgi:hypothetical protein
VEAVKMLGVNLSDAAVVFSVSVGRDFGPAITLIDEGQR